MNSKTMQGKNDVHFNVGRIKNSAEKHRAEIVADLRSDERLRIYWRNTLALLSDILKESE